MPQYLLFPVNEKYKKNRYYLRTGDGRAVLDFKAAYAPEDPVFFAHIDVTRFGDGCKITDADGNVFPAERSDRLLLPCEIPGGTDLRPAVHFTTNFGWTNDPNGLVYSGGLYHMFYQHNPMGTVWDNMTWGYATSPDLVHWTDHGDRVFPDEMGTMFSGCAVIDERNVSGLGENSVLFYYTCAGGESVLSAGKPITQCLAYSPDNMETITKYPGNPVFPFISEGNRDPNVRWSDELGKYTLSLYMGDNGEHRYNVYVSDDLIGWTFFCDIVLPQDRECPLLYPLPAEDGVKWVFSGANDTYLVGDLTKDGYRPQQEFQCQTIWPRYSYASQLFSGTGRRRIKIAWDKVAAPGAVFNSQMSFPVEMFLRNVGGIWRLGAFPVREIGLLRRFRTESLVTCGSAGVTFPGFADDRAALVTLEIGDSPFTVEAFGETIEFDPGRNEIRMEGLTSPLTYSGERNAVILADTLSIEIYADGGLINANRGIIADRSRGIRFASRRADVSVRMEEIGL